MPTPDVTVPVLWVSRHPEILARGYADQGLLEAVLDRSLWRVPGCVELVHQEVRDEEWPDLDGAVVVINGRTHASDEDVEWLLGQLDRLAWSVLLLCGDEEWVFPWRRIPRSTTRHLWVMQARPEHVDAVDGFLPGGWYPGTREWLRAPLLDGVELGPDGVPPKGLRWMFAGQVTHERREACAAALRTMKAGVLVETERYLQRAFDEPTYFATMRSARYVPSPSGPFSVDCARTFEALEAGCIPIADTETAYAGRFDYWAMLLGETPEFPRLSDWSQLPDLMDRLDREWPHNANAVGSQWQRWKRDLAWNINSSIMWTRWGQPRSEMVWPAPSVDDITVVVTTSPVPGHPSTDDISAVIESVCAQLPHAEILIAADGVRGEQSGQRAEYGEYLRRLLWKANHEWSNVCVLVADQWGHQAHTARMALDEVRTSLVLFVEHDTPLVGEVDWLAASRLVSSGALNVLRFHEDVGIHEDHEHVMLDETPRVMCGVPVIRTAAWWQRPHLARTSFYRQKIMPMFRPESRTMIEDVVYSVMWADLVDRGAEAWDDWRVAIYAPAGDPVLGFRRSGHLDSRGAQDKFGMWS